MRKTTQSTIRLATRYGSLAIAPKARDAIASFLVPLSNSLQAIKRGSHDTCIERLRDHLTRNPDHASGPTRDILGIHLAAGE